MQPLNVNHAEPTQLRVLLDLLPGEAEQLIARKPFTSGRQLRAAIEELRLRSINETPASWWTEHFGLLPITARILVNRRPWSSLDELRNLLGLTAEQYARLAAATSSSADLELTPIDPNTVTHEEWMTRFGLSETEAQSLVAHGPYYFTDQLEAVPDLRATTRALLETTVATREIGYADKLSGQTVTLTPSRSIAISVRRPGDDETESVAAIGLGLTVRDAGPDFSVLEASDAESSNLWKEVTSRKLHHLVPGFEDGRGATRIIHPTHCVVQFHDDVSPGRQDELIRRLGLVLHERHASAGLVTLAVPGADTAPQRLAAALQRLNAQPEVRFAEPNYLAHGDLENASVNASARQQLEVPRWHHDMLGIERAWKVTRGDPNVIIAIIDTGVDFGHPALTKGLLRRASSQDWNFEDHTLEPEDDHGHGTFIAGLLVGNGHQGLSGVCPDCSILPLKIPLTGSLNSYVRRREAILYALDHVGPGQRLIINLSWQTTGDVTLISDAIDIASKRGALVVASAGNWPRQYDQPHFPSDYASVISVAALGPDGRKPKYSFSGRQVDLCAPGGGDADDEKLVSAMPGGELSKSSGTSFAAPHVAGLAALVWSACPSMSAAEVRLALEDTAKPVIDAGMGRGLIHADAVTSRPRAPGPVASGLDDAAGGILQFVNHATHQQLVDSGFLGYSARIITARQPLTSLEQLLSISGTDASHVRGLAARGLSEHESSLTATAGPDEPTSLSQLFIPLMRWQPIGAHAAIVQRYHQRSLATVEQTLERFRRAGVGQRVSEAWRQLDADSRIRIATASETHWRNLARPDDLFYYSNSIEAERRRRGLAPWGSTAVWTARTDAVYPADGPATLNERLSTGAVVDFTSPVAERRLRTKTYPFVPYEPSKRVAVLAKLERALELLRLVPPAFEIVDRHVTSIIVGNHPPPGTISNESHPAFIGRAGFLNADGDTSVAWYADALLHEAIHNTLYVIEQEEHLLLPPYRELQNFPAEMLRSTWTGANKEIHTFAHAILVWFGLWQFWSRIVGLGSPHVDESDARRHHDTALRGFLAPALEHTLPTLARYMNPGSLQPLEQIVRGVPAGRFGSPVALSMAG